jgi:flagellum-specific peptidoglycan hydrolase FlgJ
MNWKFFKTNWFTIALVILVLAAIARHKVSPGAQPARPKPVESNQEKYTAAGDNAQLGFAVESLAAASENAADKATAIAFVRRFEQVAVSERKKFGIPSSVLLACAFVNSAAGKSETVAQANNYFALPCGSDWEGEQKTVNSRCIRRYESAWASFRDFSIYLTSQEWYGGVKKSAGKDWEKWIKALGQHGVPGTTGGNEALENAIRTYRLYDLDAL